MNQINLFGQSVGVTGANSMIGRAVTNKLVSRGCVVYPCYHDQYDLREKVQVQRYFSRYKPQYLIHLAGFNGNIDFNLKYPATIFQATSLININTLYGAMEYGVQKCVSVLASCAYPGHLDLMREEDLWNGACNNTVKCHGTAKRMLDIFSACLNSQHGCNFVTNILNNSYGPYDSYNPQKTKVVGGLIKKYVDAVECEYNQVTNWGSGIAKREFVYCEDAAEGIVQTLERYNEELPLNIGSGDELSIKELAEKISDFSGYTGETLWDTAKADGQLRKRLDLTRMKKYLDINFTPIDVGLINTIEWYKNNKHNLNENIRW